MVSVILPCYNESGSIVALIREIHHQLMDVEHEIIVVDDNSPDGTFKLVKELNLDFVKPILRTIDRGFAKSIRTGIEIASGDIIIVMDSDFNHQPKYLRQMIVNLQFYDCVYGSRFVYGGAMESRTRMTFSWLFNLYIRLLTRKYITDSLYGFYAIRKNVLFRLNFDKIFFGYGDYCIRLMYFLQKSNATILQFPAENGKRIAGKGQSRFLKVFLQYTVATIKLVISELKF